MKLSCISRIALIVLMGAASAQGETQELTPEKQIELIENITTPPSISEYCEFLMSLYNRREPYLLPGSSVYKALVLATLQDNSDLDKKDIQDIHNKLELLDIVIGMQWARDQVERAQERLKKAQELGVSETIKDAQKSLDKSQQLLLAVQETFRKRAEELSAQTKQ